MINQSDTPMNFTKSETYAGLVGNEFADALEKCCYP